MTRTRNHLGDFAAELKAQLSQLVLKYQTGEPREVLTGSYSENPLVVFVVLRHFGFHHSYMSSRNQYSKRISEVTIHLDILDKQCRTRCIPTMLNLDLRQLTLS